MSGPRVHFINRYFHPDHSATSQILTGVATELAGQGFDVHVATSRQLYEQPAAALPRHERVEGVSVTRLATTRFGRTSNLGRLCDYVSFYVLVAWYLLRSTRKGDVVVAKTDPPLLSVITVPIARLKGAIAVNWLQDVFPEVAEAMRPGRWSTAFAALRRIRNWSLHTAARNIAIGNRMARHLLEQGVSPATLTVMPNWADPDVIRPLPPDASSLRAAWGLKDKFVVGYSGNFGRVHDMHTMVDAIEVLQSRPVTDAHGREIAFLFVGNGAQRLPLEAEVTRRALRNVHFRPYQPQALLSESLAAADVHLVSLRPELEGLVVPSKIYGIMAAGRPAIFIGDPKGEVASLIETFGLGTSVAASQPNDLARAITELALNAAAVEAMGASARRTFETSFTRQQSARDWCLFLSSIDLREAGDARACRTRRRVRSR